MIKLTGNQN